ncbi:phosphoribosyltransferase [Candidatus Dependentiae bacterium]|nr:phosphoribosyltransferase [Candidatus Dependentiae bacterium]
MFKNREEAAKELATKLKDYKNKSNTIIIGLPRGGIPIAAIISKEFNIPFDIVVTKKLKDPINSELAFGAITQDGTPILDYKIIQMYQIKQDYIQKEIKNEFQEIQRRLKKYRKNKPPLNVKNKIVIIVDDGIATGATMKAAIETIRKQSPSKIIIAIPVAPTEVIDELKNKVDKIICIKQSANFFAVGQFYKQFPQLEDVEILKILKNFKADNQKG